MTIGRPPKPVPERFWSKVNKAGPYLGGRLFGRCWLWTGKPTPDGYGILRIKGFNEPAHRLSWELAHDMEVGSLPTEEQVLHRCDNPPCVRPSHLFLGDAIANNADRDSKGRGRWASGDEHGLRLHPEVVRRGETSNLAKLTWEQVRAIRASYTGKRGEKANLARAYGISPANVKLILDGKIWRE